MSRAQRQRFNELHRRVSAAGRRPAPTLAGLEAQAALLDRGVLQPVAPPSAEMRRVVKNDTDRWLSRIDTGREDADEADTRSAWAPEELRELKGPEHGNERVTPITSNDGDAP